MDSRKGIYVFSAFGKVQKITRTIADIRSAVRDLQASETLRSEHLNDAFWGEVCKHLGITNKPIHRKRVKQAYIYNKQQDIGTSAEAEGDAWSPTTVQPTSNSASQAKGDAWSIADQHNKLWWRLGSLKLPQYRVNTKGEGAACAPVMTSGNGTTTSSQHNGDSKAAQAIVKSHILTHLIEGFVIQEGAEPFPVERPSFCIESLRRHTADTKMDSLTPKALKAQQEPMLTCELCGRVDFAYIFKRSKRFCSTVCAKRYNVGCTKRMGLFPNRKTTLENMKKQRTLNGNHKNSSLESKKKTGPSVQKPSTAAPSIGHSTHPVQGESSQCSDLSGHKGALSPPLAPQQDSELPLFPHSFLPSDPGQWNIQDVYEFISSLQGCLEIAEEFRAQEIDGQALLLLKEDHLMGAMNIKLGPALKIFAQINLLKDS